MGMRAGEEGRRGLAGVRSINHDPCYDKLHYLSSTSVVLVFNELDYLFERFCKKKKTKG
jgi:hypothetical protein